MCVCVCVWLASSLWYTTKIILVYEPAHDKTYNNSCVTSKDSGQPAHQPYMAMVLVSPLWIGRRLQKAHAIKDDSDQTARMRMLICVFAGRTSIIAGFIVRWFIYKDTQKRLQSGS